MRPASIVRTPWAAVALGLFAAACAQGPVEWHKPGASREQWAGDQSACRLNARRQAEKRFHQLGSEVGSPVYSTAHTLAQDMAILEAKKHERRLFESCLKARGYSKQTKTNRG